MPKFQSGAIPRSPDVRDVDYSKLGSSGVLPESYSNPHVITTKKHYQGDTPTCGAHAGAHAKQLLDVNDTGEQAYSPYYLWKKIKSFDGHKPSVGTDLRSILHALKHYGICDEDLLPSQNNRPIAEYSKDDTTKEQNDNAKPRMVGTYGFTGTNPEKIKRAIYDNGAVILLIRFGNEYWNKKVVDTNGNRQDGHFVIAYGWQKDNSWEIYCSADKRHPFKTLKPSFRIEDGGVMTDVPDSEVRDMIDRLYWLQKLVELVNLLKKKV